MEVSKSSLMARWRTEERWEQIDGEKNARIRELRAGGMSKAEASDRAWLDMADKYPPLDKPEQPPPDLADFDPASSDFVIAAQWVFDNLARRVKSEDAPSAGAWAMLEWARGNREDFFKSIMPKALDIESKRGGAVDDQAIEEQSECEGMDELLIGEG